MTLDLSDFNPAFGTRLDSLKAELDKEGIGYNLASGYRSPEYQNQMYQNHLAKQAKQPLPYPNVEAPDVVAKPWSSFHNYGLAADFSLKNDADYARLAALAPQFGLTGIGSSDKGHIQLAGNLGEDISQYHLAGWRPASQPAPTTGALAYSGPAGVLASQETSPENVGAAAPSATSAGPQDPRQIVFNRLVAAGVPKQAALGALWSLGGEGGKGLDPRSYNADDPGGSIGYGQWNGVRRTALEDLAKTNGTAWSDPNTQADHIINELTNKNYASYQPGVLDKLKAAKTPEEAAAIWTSKFERPAKDNSDQRIAGGTQVATLDDNGNLVLGSATGGGPAPASTTAAAPTVASGASAPATAPAAPPTDDRPWYSKAFGALMQGKEGQKSPFEQVSEALTGPGSAGSKAAMEAQAPQRGVLSAQGPGARNVSPLLASIPQTYGQTINSLSQPLTWSSRPPGAPQTPAAGLQASPMGGVPGISLNSIQPLSQGIGYGVPAVGYGYG